MPSERELWPRLEAALERLLELDGPARTHAVREIVATEPELRTRLEALLAADAAAGGVLDRGVGDIAAALLGETSDDAAQLAASPAVPVVDRYRVLRLLGRGGMGSVWLAERSDGQFGRQVALKVLDRGVDREETRRRFQREREILARLDHPDIARLLDGGVTADGRPWFVMEAVDGQAITEYADALRLDLDARLRLFEAVCEAVAYAQRHLVIHRDLKPSNILVTAEGQVKLLDFGIARLIEESDSETPGLTQQGAAPMTPDHAAPEQLRGEPMTTATDVYALGVLLFELLSGRFPYATREPGLLQALRDHEREARSLANALDDAAEPSAEAQVRSTTLASLRQRLQGELAIIVDTSLRREPERRYASAEALLQDVRRLREGHPLQARPATVGYRLRKHLRRNRVVFAGLAGAVLALAIGLASTAWQAREARRQAARAGAVTEFLTELFESADPDEWTSEEPRVRDLLARGAQRADTALAGDPEAQADLLLMMGKLYDKLGDFDAALPLLRRAYVIRTSLHRPEHPSRREAQIALGSTHLQAVHFGVAESLLYGVLAHFDRRAARPDPQLPLLINTLAVLEHRRGDRDSAEALDREALALDRILHGPDHLEVAMDLDNLGTHLAEAGRFAEAESLAIEALAIRRRHLPSTHSSIPASLHNLAYAIQRQGRLGEADSLYAQATALRRRLHPDGHPLLASTLRERGALRIATRDFAGAETLLVEALAMNLRYLGERHTEVALSHNEIGLLGYRRGDYASAAEQFATAVRILEQVLPEGHSTTTTVRANLTGTRAKLQSGARPASE